MKWKDEKRQESDKVVLSSLFLFKGPLSKCQKYCTNVIQHKKQASIHKQVLCFSRETDLMLMMTSERPWNWESFDNSSLGSFWYTCRRHWELTLSPFLTPTKRLHGYYTVIYPMFTLPFHTNDESRQQKKVCRN